MEQIIENHGFENANVEILKKKTNNIIKSHKCNQCDYASSHTGNLRTHLKMHSGEKPNKCNQCDYAAGNLRTQRGKVKHAINVTLDGKKCNQCDFASKRTVERVKQMQPL